MKLMNEILASLQEDAPVRSILVGAHWTLVCSRFCGLASTMMSDCAHAHFHVQDAGNLHKKSALELAQYALSDNLLEASIGVATINSLLDLDESRSEEINAAEVLIERGKGKNVALVGHFPFIPKVRKAVGKLWVIEQRPVADDFPAEAAADLIPQADVVALTGTALINHTLEGLLALCQPGSMVLILGPSTPLSPIFFEHGVTILCGSRVVDENVVQRTVGQGASFQQVEGVRLLSLAKDRGVDSGKM